jgi:hypothetical protein
MALNIIECTISREWYNKEHWRYVGMDEKGQRLRLKRELMDFDIF